jgi:hypothetical protein
MEKGSFNPELPQRFTGSWRIEKTFPTTYCCIRKYEFKGLTAGFPIYIPRGVKFDIEKNTVESSTINFIIQAPKEKTGASTGPAVAVAAQCCRPGIRLEKAPREKPPAGQKLLQFSPGCR